MTTLFLTACGKTGALEKTNNELFRQLGQTLPTVSTRDTSRTRREVATHRAVFFALCDVLDGPETACEVK